MFGCRAETMRGAGEGIVFICPAFVLDAEIANMCGCEA